jgi:hypothetical protein
LVGEEQVSISWQIGSGAESLYSDFGRDISYEWGPWGSCKFHNGLIFWCTGIGKSPELQGSINLKKNDWLGSFMTCLFISFSLGEFLMLNACISHAMEAFLNSNDKKKHCLEWANNDPKDFL